MTGSSRERGARAERDVCRVIRDRFPGLPVKRTGQLQNLGSGSFLPDVTGLPGWHIEVKSHKKIGSFRFFEQALRDCQGRGAGDKPLVVMRESGKNKGSGWLAMLDFEDFLDILESGDRCGEV